MKKILTSFMAFVIAIPGAFSADYADAQTARAGSITAQTGIIVGAQNRAPSMPPINLPGGTTVNPGTNNPSSGDVVQVAPPAYGVEQCMTDLTNCVNGTLPEGLASMYNADMRNSVVNGMNLCGTVIDKCINDTTRLDGKKAYYARNDIWIDFNSRIIQPQYYTHVMIKTGLTPNQAENTCRLLDRNTFGSSFTAVNANGGVTNEYNRNVNPYNSMGNGKANPMGQVVNAGGAVDSQRGHYARWDAASGECLVRVAAYNKNELITNEWMWGWAGDKQPAEVWKAAGSSFSCKKETFDFNLMRNTINAASIAGTTAVVATGAAAGIAAGAANKKWELNPVNCGDKEFRDVVKAALKDMKESGSVATNDQCINTLAKYGIGGTSQEYENAKQRLLSALGCSAGSDSPCEMILALGANVAKDENIEKVKSIANSSNDTGKSEAVAFLPLLLAQQEAAKNTRNETFANAFENNNGMGAGAAAGKAALITGGITVGAGGIATAITAFVEHNNITCRIGDGLEQVGFGKSGRVKSLKEFYVEWALNLPDTVMPQQIVTECNSWNSACNSINNIYDCAQAVVTYKPNDNARSTQVEAACTVSGSTCVANNPVAISHGACM